MFILFRITCSVSVFCCILNSDGKRFVIPAEQYQETNLRVINGRDKLPDEYAFVIVLISYEYEFIGLCTGAMLTEVWGLTAAHCTILDMPYHAWFSNFTVPPIRLDTAAEVFQTYTHPAFRILIIHGIAENDICLFHSSRVNVKSFARLSSVDRSAMTGLPVKYVGGGWTTMAKDKASVIKHQEENKFKQLQVGEGAIVRCNKEARMVSKYAMCVVSKCADRMQIASFGDSGGPLIHDNRIVGVCSFYAGIHNISVMGFTPISPYLDWIYLVMNSKDKY